MTCIPVIREIVCSQSAAIHELGKVGIKIIQAAGGKFPLQAGKSIMPGKMSSYLFHTIRVLSF